MYSSMIWIILFFEFLSVVNCEEPTTKIVRVKIETCAGCKLYNLPDLKAFIFEDFPKYKNAELKLITGASPILIFLTESDEVVERISLAKLSRKECREILASRGFKKSNVEEGDDKEEL